MSTISVDDVKKLASLSAITLDEGQVTNLKDDLAEILLRRAAQCCRYYRFRTYLCSSLLDTVVRSDEIIDYGVSQDELLKNAADKSSDGNSCAESHHEH